MDGTAYARGARDGKGARREDGGRTEDSDEGIKYTPCVAS